MCIKILLCFPCGFGLSVMTPLNFEHPHYLVPGLALLAINDLNWELYIGKVRVYRYFFLLNNCCWNSHTFLELRYMEDVVYS